MSLMDRMESRLGRFAVSRLIVYVATGQGLLFFLEAWRPGFIESAVLLPSRVLDGEFWRVVTFVFVPLAADPFSLVFSLLFVLMCGMSLEAAWGSFRFNVFYFLGIVGTLAGAFLVPGIQSGNMFLNETLLLAYAATFPDASILIFFVIPIKVRWLGWAMGAVFLYQFLRGGLADRLVILAGLMNFFLFVGLGWLRRGARTARSAAKTALIRPQAVHVCGACGATELKNPEQEFRFCSDCEKEYCIAHLENHSHA